MQLNKKKELAARTLKVGKGRIVFNKERLDEIKEAITKQDIKELKQSGAIMINEISGRRNLSDKKRKTRRRVGSIKIKVNKKKAIYMAITRKLRIFLSELRKKKIVTSDEYLKLRKEIRAHSFKSKANFKERLNQLLKEKENK